jgi:hypothetical protein
MYWVTLVRLTALREEMKGTGVQRIAVIAAVAISLGAWSARAAPTNIKSVEAAAHGAYVAAINSNDTETLLADLTDDKDGLRCELYAATSSTGAQAAYIREFIALTRAQSLTELAGVSAL